MTNLLGEDNSMTMMQQLQDMGLPHAPPALEEDGDDDMEGLADAVRTKQLEELADIAALRPNDGQARVLRKVRRTPHGLVVISGGPGSGKTFITKHLVHHFRSRGNKVVSSCGHVGDPICMCIVISDDVNKLDAHMFYHIMPSYVYTHLRY